MRASLNSGHFALMARPVIDPQWLMALPAFFSEDASVVRAVFKLLQSAWQGSPAGTLNVPSIRALAEMTGLPLESTTRQLDVLQQGWKIKADVWTFEPMAKVAHSILATHKDALEHLANELIVQAQSPDLFSPCVADTRAVNEQLQHGQSLPVIRTAKAKAAVKRLLPEDFELSQAMIAEAQNQGFGIARHREIAQLFSDFARSRAERSADWDATFRNWLRRAIQWQTIMPDASGSVTASGPLYQFNDAQVVRPHVTAAPKSARARDDSFLALQKARQVYNAYSAASEN